MYGSYRSERMGIRLTDHFLEVMSGEPSGDMGASLQKALPRFANDLSWWTEAAKTMRARKAPPF